MQKLKVTSETSWLKEVLEEIADNLKVEVEESGLKVTWVEGDKRSVVVEVKEEELIVTAKDLPHFLQGVAEVSKNYLETGSISDTKWDYSYERNGLMLDCSRNAVASVDYVKSQLRKMASMGHTWYMLYVEDTYEIKGEPYFGAYRGRYSQDDLKELDRYANKLGIEIFPAIQTLAHLNQFLYWEHEQRKYGDIDDILNVGRDETHELVRKMITQLKSCFTSKRIHLGMDEAYNLGRGSYLDEFGLKEKPQIMYEYLEFLRDVCVEEGLTPIIWDDMFFSHYSKLDDEDEDFKVPDGVELMHWDYYRLDSNEYKERLEERAKITHEVNFAGGVWRWAGYVPHHMRTLNTSIAAHKAAKEVGVENVITTAWGDDGSEAPFEVVDFGLVLYSYLDRYDEYKEEEFDSYLRFHTDLSYQDWLKQGAFDFVPVYKQKGTSDPTPSKYFLYQDLLSPMFQVYIEEIGFDYGEYVSELADYFEGLDRGNLDINHFYSEYGKTLAVKWDLPLRIYQAYHKDDKEELLRICQEDLPELVERLENLLEARRVVWLKESNPQGLEVIEYRFGSMITRAKAVSSRLTAYVDGEVDSIPELEEERLNPIPSSNPKEEKVVHYNRSQRIMTRNRMDW